MPGVNIKHKLNALNGVAWCGEKHKQWCTNFVRRWKDTTCPGCLEHNNQKAYQSYYKSFPVDRKTYPVADMDKLRAYWKNREIQTKMLNELKED